MSDVAVVAAYQAQHGRLLERLDALVASVWLNLGTWNDTDLAAFVAEIEIVTGAAHAAVTRAVDAYVARLTRTAPVGLEPVGNLRGLPPEDLWRRPFLDTWTSLKDGADLADAVDIGKNRAQQIASLDVQRAQVAAMDQALDAHPEIIGYRRVLTGKSCRFCAAASTRIYHKKTLMPLHTHCDCSVAPVIGDRDPGLTANKARLTALKAQGPDYWKRNGFVDTNGNPIDPTDLPDADVVVNSEVGPVLNTAA